MLVVNGIAFNNTGNTIVPGIMSNSNPTHKMYENICNMFGCFILI